MKFKKYLTTTIQILFLSTLSSPILAEDEHHLETNSSEEFEISKKAEITLGIKTNEIISLGRNLFEVPSQSIVYFGENKGIYLYDGRHYQLIKILIKKSKKSVVKIESSELKKGDKIVTKGVPLLRVAHLQASGQGGEGHGH